MLRLRRCLSRMPHDYRTKIGMTKVVLRELWGCHHCRTDRGPPCLKMPLRHVPNFVRKLHMYDMCVVQNLPNKSGRSRANVGRYSIHGAFGIDICYHHPQVVISACQDAEQSPDASKDMSCENGGDTVDGRNPAPPGIYKTLYSL